MMAMQRVLIVEDHAPPARRWAIFARTGREVTEAATVAEALAGLDPAPGCVVLDLLLPDGAGESVLRKIRGDGLSIPVVVITGLSDPIRLGDVVKLQPGVAAREAYRPRCHGPAMRLGDEQDQELIAGPVGRGRRFRRRRLGTGAIAAVRGHNVQNLSRRAGKGPDNG